MQKEQRLKLLMMVVVFVGTIGMLGCSAIHGSIINGNKPQSIEHNSYVTTIRYSSDGKRLFSQGDADGKIIIWNVIERQPGNILVSPFQGGSDSTASKFELSPNEDILAYSRGGDVHLVDYDKQITIGVLDRNPAKWVTKISFMQNGKYLAIDNDIWDLDRKNKYSSIPNFDQLMFLPGKEVLVMGGEQAVAFYDIHTKEEIHKIKTSTVEGHVGQVLFTSDGKRGFALNEHGHLSYFNVETGDVLKSFWPHQLWREYKIGIGKIILDEPRERLYGISISYKHFYVSVFDLEKGELQKATKRALPIPMDLDTNAGQEILDAVLCPDGTTLAISGEDCKILLLDIKTLQTKGILGEGCRVAPYKRRGRI